MNIFFLDHNPVTAATMMCDKHVVKMILESSDLLAIAHFVLDDNNILGLNDKQLDALMKHKNHPCAVWVREDACNYRWLYQHLVSLLDEYNYRYRKYHASIPASVLLSKLPKCIPYTSFGITTPVLCMPDKHKLYDKFGSPLPVCSYRRYYRLEKRHLLKYTRRLAPEWLTYVDE